MKMIVKWILPFILLLFLCGTDSKARNHHVFVELPNEKNDHLWKFETYHDSILVGMLCSSEKYLAVTKYLDQLKRTADQLVTELPERKYYNKNRFSMFNVDSIYNGKLAKPNLKDSLLQPGGHLSYIDGCNATGVNFAGHYTIMGLNCGCMCQCVVVVDRISGKVFPHQSFDSDGGHFGFVYRINSRMLILDAGFLDEEKYWDHTSYLPLKLAC